MHEDVLVELPDWCMPPDSAVGQKPFTVKHKTGTTQVLLVKKAFYFKPVQTVPTSLSIDKYSGVHVGFAQKNTISDTLVWACSNIVFKGEGSVGP